MSDALLTSIDLTELYPTAYVPRPSHDFGVGRVGDCGHRLCRYDPGPVCWVCEWETAHRPGICALVEPAQPIEVTCHQCGATFYTSAHNARYCTAQCRHVAWVARQRARVAT